MEPEFINGIVVGIDIGAAIMLAFCIYIVYKYWLPRMTTTTVKRRNKELPIKEYKKRD